MTADEKTKLVATLKAVRMLFFLVLPLVVLVVLTFLGVFWVVVVGVPLERPSIETNALISSITKQYGKGWGMGMFFPR